MEILQAEVMTAVFAAISGILVTIIGVVAKKFVTWLNSKTTANIINDKDYIFYLAVKAVEQIYKNAIKPTAEEKRNKAIEIATRMANEVGIKITEAEIDGFLESSVLTLTEELKKAKVYQELLEKGIITQGQFDELCPPVEEPIAVEEPLDEFQQ